MLQQAKWHKEKKRLEIEMAQKETRLRAQKRKIVQETNESMQVYKMELLRCED